MRPSLRIALFLAACAVLGGSLPRAAGAQALSAQEMMAAADKIRNPGEPFRMTTALVEYVGGRAQRKLVVVVFAKQNASKQFSNIVYYADPPRDKGKLLLQDGKRMWFYDPASKASVRLSAQQRLIGQASNSDVMSINMAKDYSAKLIGAESLQDADRKNRDCWHLDLAAATDDAVYNRVEFWLEKDTYRPVKARYYSDSGRVLKIVYYRKYQDQLGGVRPTETIIIDAVDSQLVTIMSTSDYRVADIPDAWFQRDFLQHFKLDR